MTRFYLIAGFLGAGKTSFMRQALPALSREKTAVIVNDFGRERVDAAMLEGMGVTMKEINNGSIFCACRAEQFSEALEQVLDQEPDVILTEASGLADPSDLGLVLQYSNRLCFGGTICVLDGARFHKVRATALVARQQLASADAVIINKVDLATPEQLENIHRDIEALCPGVPVLETSYSKIPEGWLEQVVPRHMEGSRGAPHQRDITLQKLTLHLEPGLSRERLERFLEKAAPASYRIKGFAALAEGLMLVDCVGDAVSITPWEGAGAELDCLTVLFGNGLPARKTIRAALEGDPLCSFD